MLPLPAVAFNPAWLTVITPGADKPRFPAVETPELLTVRPPDDVVIEIDPLPDELSILSSVDAPAAEMVMVRFD